MGESLLSGGGGGDSEGIQLGNIGGSSDGGGANVLSNVCGVIAEDKVEIFRRVLYR